MLSIIFLALLTAALETEAPPAETCIVGGVIVDASNKPVAGATVTAFDYSKRQNVSRKTQTDENGHFDLDISFIEPANRLQYRPCGLLANTEDSAGYYVFGYMPEITLNEARDIKIKISPSVKVEGKVIDSKGNPVGEARINSTISSFIQPDTVSNVDGTFEFYVPRSFIYESDSSSQPPLLTASKDGYAIAKTNVSLPKNSEDSTLQVTLRLSDARKKAVFRTVDTSGNPLVGIEFRLQFINDNASHSFILVDIRKSSNAEGLIEFDMIPNWASEPVVFAPSMTNKYALGERPIFNPEKDSEKEIIVTMLDTVQISGTIRKEDGTPLANALLYIACHSANDKPYYSQGTTTDEQGRYSVMVCPDMVYGSPVIAYPLSKEYMITSDEDKIVYPGKPVEDFDFIAKKAIKIHGNITFPPQKEAETETTAHYIILNFLQGEPSNAYDSSTKEAVDSHGNTFTYFVQEFKKTLLLQNDSYEPVKYEVYLPAGTYTVTGTVEQKTFQVKDDAEEVLLDLVVKAEEAMTIASTTAANASSTANGRVVRKVNDEMVPASGVIIEEEKNWNDEVSKTISNEDGTFSLKHSQSYDNVGVYARTADFSEVGFIISSNKKGEIIEIELKPAATLKGRLVDTKTGKIVADSKIECIGPVVLGERVMLSPYFYDLRSDKEGCILMKGFLPGSSYQIQCEPLENADEGASAMVGFFHPLEPGEFDAEDIKILDLRTSNQIEKFVFEPFRQKESAKERLETAKKTTAETKKPILLLFTWAIMSEDNEAFGNWFFNVVFGINAQKYLSNFEYVPVDLSDEAKETSKAEELAADLGVTLPKEDDFLICIVNPDGKIVTKRNFSDFRAPKFKPDGELILDFDTSMLFVFLREFGKK
ncbi:MAG: carboxypeptidase regulatory-like domain-containing protein [Thermoguttaceae bacterium]